MLQALDRVELALESRERVDRAHQLEMENFHSAVSAIGFAKRRPHLPEATLTDHPV
jgi:hypothetical protein